MKLRNTGVSLWQHLMEMRDCYKEYKALGEERRVLIETLVGDYLYEAQTIS